MSLAEIHTRASRFRTQIARRNLIEYAAAALVIVVFAYIAFIVPAPFVKAGAIVLILGMLYVVSQLHQLARAAAQDEINAAADLMGFHRQELVRQRDALRGVWSWYLGPLIPGAVLFLFGAVLSAPGPLGAQLSVGFAGLGLLGAMFAAIGWLNQRAAAKLDADIAAIDRARGG
ncbi:MAG TPA: hypothetical protein PKY87_09960 [Terricaulis sp.]|jgi:hypothetical protein|nr:hypothetical protein [Terricaulis sp.]